MNEDPSRNNDTFKQLRRISGLSQIEVSSLVGVSVPTIRAWESDKARVQESALRVLKVHLLLQGKIDVQLPE